MYSLILFLTAIFLAGIGSTTVRFDQFANSSFQALLPNRTVLTAHTPDSRFKLQAHYTNERLPATAVLMNTVWLLGEAADLDFKSQVDFHKEAALDEYPAVSIDLKTAKPRDRLLACFWVWALYGAAFDMIIHTRFVVSEFDIMWKGKIIAKLQYQKGKAAGLIDDSGSSDSADVLRDKRVMEASRMTVVNLTSTAVQSYSSDESVTLELQYLENAKNIPILTIFMVVLTTLKDNAEYPATARTQPFETKVRGFDAKLEIMRNEGPPIRRPPFFERADVNKAVRQLPELMLQQGKFAEISFIVDVDGKE